MSSLSESRLGYLDWPVIQSRLKQIRDYLNRNQIPLKGRVIELSWQAEPFFMCYACTRLKDGTSYLGEYLGFRLKVNYDLSSFLRVTNDSTRSKTDSHSDST